MRDGEDHMKVTTGQKFLSAFFQPLFFCHGLTFRAVAVPAGVVAVPDCPALITDLLMATKLGCSTGQYCRHNLALIDSHCMLFPVVVTIFAENVGYFVVRPHIQSSCIKESRGLDMF